MSVLSVIKKRRSIRSYEQTPIPEDKLRRILEAARLASSASNIQPWHFIVVKDKEKRKAIARTGIYARFLSKSPIVIVGCGDWEASPKWHIVDVAIAMQNMVLAATDEGLGTCWVRSFNERKIKELLKIPDKFNVVALLALGYPKEKIDFQRALLHLFRRRKSLEKIVSSEEYGKEFRLSETQPT